MTLLFYSLQLFIVGILSYQDWRTKQVSVLGLFGLITITIPGLIILDFPIHYEMVLIVLGSLGLIKLIGFLSVGKSLMGNGDFLLLLPLLCSIHLEELPLFLISAGIAGVLTSTILHEKSVPFVPALSFAYGLILVLRLL